MQRFILKQNIMRFRALLKEEGNQRALEYLGTMLAKALRELAVLEASSEGFSMAVNLVHADAQHRIFRDEFEKSPHPHLLLDPRKGLHIVDMNAAYGAATLTSSATASGRPMFDVFPDNPSDASADGVSNLHQSLKNAAEQGVTQVMAIQRYDVRDQNGVFVPKFWMPMNTPIFDADGHLLYLLHQAEDVTERMVHGQLIAPPVRRSKVA